MRIIQISDTHHSVAHPYFSKNVSATTRWLKSAEADLVIHTGDLAMDGAGNAHELTLGAEWLKDTGHDMFVVPGNHDVGDHVAIKPTQQVDDARLDQWRNAIGPDFWSLDRNGWRLIGLDAMLMGTGHREEARQFEWFADALDTTAPIAVFLHKPLFIDHPEEGPRGYWTVTPEPRRTLLAMMQKADIRLVASGHLHIQRQYSHGDTAFVWGPASSFVVGDSQEDLGGDRLLGAVVHDFSETGVASTFIRPQGLEDLLIDPVADLIYRAS
jgi:3',5'-cyclic AMP phosphodiesterase CpdA